MKEGKADNEHSNPRFIAPCPRIHNICISHLQFLHFQKFLLEVVAIGRKNAGWEPDNVLMYSNKNSHNWKKPLQLEERDSDARDVSGVKTPLFLAIRAKHLPAIRLLIGTHLSILSKYCTFSQCS
jgi:hypothetical protein